MSHRKSLTRGLIEPPPTDFLTDGDPVPGWESTLQLFDQAVEGLAFLLLDARHAAKAGGAVSVAGGFRGRDRLLVLREPVFDVAAVLCEHPPEVVGLAAVRRRGGRGRGLRPGHRLTDTDGDGSDHAAAGPAPAPVANGV